MLTNDLNDALLRMLNNLCGVPEAVVVTGFEQYEASGGACSTCRWTEIRVRIDYVDRDETPSSYDYHGDMANLIRDLTA